MSLTKLKRKSLKGLLTAVLASGGVLFGVQGLQGVIANGDTRTISLFHTHTRESINITFKKNGRYDSDALKKLNYFLRDWRNDDVIKMDPRLFDLVWEVYREANARQPIQIVSAYRSPKTNAMLRSRSKGVAKNSQHTHGRAMDFRIPGVGADTVRAIGLRLQRGGVGYYPGGNSYFIHMDTGSVRHWPRMTRSQLARVFPDGRTIHVPSDGKPMPGYALAMADLKRGGSVAPETSSSGGLFARLFGGDEEEETTAAAPVQVAAAQRAAPAPAPAAPVAAPQPAAPVLAAAPAMPMPRPSGVAANAQVQMASLAGGPRMVWQTGAEGQQPAAAPTAAAPALPLPRPASHIVAAAQESEPSMVTAFAAEPDPVPLPLRAPVQAAMLPKALPVQDVARTATVSPHSGALLRAAIAEEPRPELVTVKLDASTIRTAVTPDRITRSGENSHLSHPDQNALAALMHKPSKSLGQSFGGNPTGGLRSDMFQGRAVALIRTVRLDLAQANQSLARRGG
ncbi:hypothetical protein GCM10007276_14920 [Agaricicola taiwanensis]|uniref:Murein endopeptidase K n=1 Tax=Agaricicola taiwanensis TaxID=591372 RepID=A0A8J2VS66_9RHOB|nr:DUF882 domain-containing protein [Agaricicola taiwanensis]GGE38647.1 hypothetical protein GCM10007276_14920 [Agaricicola taiwanensis]